MPSFFCRTLPRQQLPPTPPEFVPSYHSGCGAAAFQQPYGGQPAVAHHEEGPYSAERYDHSAMLSAPTQAYYAQMAHHAPYTLPPPAYYDMSAGPLLPPMHVDDRVDMASHKRHFEQQAKAQKPREEKPTGGVSSELDYEMDTMTEFVAEVAQRIVLPTHQSQPSTRKWIHSVLSATRLPSSTIIMGMYYMNRRMVQLRESGQAMGLDVQLTRVITLGLLLGSKFLDDNTFINRSWAEVSGIAVKDLNRLEKDWLAAFEFRLHLDPAEPEGFNMWKAQWKDFEAQALARASKQTKLAPIDTSVHAHGSLNPSYKSYSAMTPYSHGFNKLPTPEYTQKPHLSQYTPSPYGHYNHAWGMSRSAVDYSPPSAATMSGPTTPEYYNAHSVWGSGEGYSRRTMFGYPPISHPPGLNTQAQHHPMSGFDNTLYNQSAYVSAWNNHGVHCNCFPCVRQHRPYLIPPAVQAVMS